jgi:UDP-glucose 6-dehydrogenase
MRQQGSTQGGENGPEIDFCGNDFMKAVDGASAIVIATEWDQFVEYNYQKLT